MTTNPIPQSSDASAPLHGLLAEFDEVGPLLAASAKVRDAGYTVWDAHTPFPVHGLDDAMGVRPTRLPWIILLAGLTGLSCAIALQWWTNAYDYPFRISGKPLWSIPANIPVMFELTVLFSALTAVFGTLGLGKLPELFHPLFLSKRFRRVTNDKFFIYIERTDPAFNEQKIIEMYHAAHATAVEPIYWDTRSPSLRIPRALVGIGAIATIFTFIPLALIARARETHTTRPRIHPIPDDMDSQYKFKAQTSNAFFGDGRSMRPPPEGVVAVEDMQNETPFYTGRLNGAFTAQFPAEVTANEQTMRRGHERFNIFCAPCHGLVGHGDGMVSRHAEALQEGTWVGPSDLHEERLLTMPVGEIFNSISHGVRNMPAYAPLIEPSDRWAIIMYVRALQLSQHAPKSAVPDDILQTLQ